MGKEISLIAFLDEVVSRNTQHYRKDFELDAQKLRDALNSPYMDERIFYFMSRPNGTWCVLERETATGIRFGHTMRICPMASKPIASLSAGGAAQRLWVML